MKNQEGYTLLEMLTVISIIGFIANIGFAMAFEAKLKAQDITNINDVRVVGQALELYYNDTGSYKITGAGWNGTCAIQTSEVALKACIIPACTGGVPSVNTCVQNCTGATCMKNCVGVDPVCVQNCIDTEYIPAQQACEGGGYGFINVATGLLYDNDQTIVDFLKNGGYLNPTKLTNEWALDHQLTPCPDFSEFSLFSRLANDDPESILLMENCNVCGAQGSYHNVIQSNRPNFVVYSGTVDRATAGCP